MGGQALKNTYTRRYSKKEYLDIEDTILSILNKYEIKCRVPKSYGAKDTFGDLDVLILAESLINRDMGQIIGSIFQPNEVYHNGSVYSFDFREFQIDFILVKTKYWDTSYHYYSYNDLGNLIGRISYQMGYRYGHFGLKLVYRHPHGGRKFETIICQNLFDILQFLGFDIDRYKESFKTIPDIFDYVIDSKYFNPRIFQYEALNHQNKTRNKKRVNYAGFLEYVDGKKFPNAYQYEDKDYYVKMAEDYFGLNIVEQIDSWKEEVERDRKIADKFNGHLIMEAIPGLKGKELGHAITNFKTHMKDELLEGDSDKLLKQWLSDNDAPFIMETFKTFYNERN